jgi:hypothetical protein
MSDDSRPAILLSTVISAMREALKPVSQEPRPAYGALMTHTLRELARIGHRMEAGDEFRDHWVRLSDRHPLSFLLVEGYFQLLALGYIAPWPNVPNAPDTNWFHLTEKGKQWILSADPIPEDPDRFIAALKFLIQNLDSVIKQYLDEAVVTYNRQAWFASAVMVGAASEKAVYMLVESLLTVADSSERKTIEKAINERNLPRMFEQINKVLTKQKESKKLPYSVSEGVEHHLLSLFESIRVQRNEAVHPTIADVSPQSVRLTLSAFPSACRKVYDLIEWAKT